MTPAGREDGPAPASCPEPSWSAPGREDVAHRVERLFREEAGRIAASLLRLLRDLDVAEEIVQDALAVALDRWPVTGIPENPGAWLSAVARNRALDHLRHRHRATASRDALAHELARPEASGPPARLVSEIPDDRLELMFVCCHPALPHDSQVALTLRMVGGLTTAEIARAFLVSEATVAQRLVRGKRAIRSRGLVYEVPGPEERTRRLAAVLQVVYLIFNEGYAAHAGPALIRVDLCEEAIRLGSVLVELAPGEAEVLGLQALMDLQASRAAARTDAAGDLVLLADQDRSRWDRARIERGLERLARAEAIGPPGPYQIQAAIAARHARAPTWEATDWPAIVGLYEALVRCAPSPIVELNRAVAVGMREGPAAALPLLDALDRPPLNDYHLLAAARADFLRRLGRNQEAAAAYRRALALTGNEGERRFLRARIAQCEAGPPDALSAAAPAG